MELGSPVLPLGRIADGSAHGMDDQVGRAQQGNRKQRPGGLHAGGDRAGSALAVVAGALLRPDPADHGRRHLGTGRVCRPDFPRCAEHPENRRRPHRHRYRLHRHCVGSHRVGDTGHVRTHTRPGLMQGCTRFLAAWCSGAGFFFGGCTMDAFVCLPALDEEGYLVEPGEWNEAVAEQLALAEDVRLTDEHWDVIRFMREYYEEHQIAPDARYVIKHLSNRLGADARNALFKLFANGYVKQACKIAGMKRPRAWSTG